MIKEISISGFRGFGQRKTVGFALPDGEKIGSGLSIITGANNSGKTTIIEAIRAFNGNESPSFSEGRRNAKTGGVVELELLDSEENRYTIKSVAGGGSSTTKTVIRFFSHTFSSRDGRCHMSFQGIIGIKIPTCL